MTLPTQPAAIARAASGVIGLTQLEAETRLRRDGPNVLPRPEQRRWPAMLVEVLCEPMIALLLGAAAVYVMLGDPPEAAALGVSVLVVAGLTLYQQQKSERALQALRELSSPRARVLRDGEWRLVAARELVVGDAIDVREGDRVPADAVLIEDAGLQLDESMLSGESVPVLRSASAPDVEDRIVRASTLAVAGHGSAHVVAVGSDTQVGRIGQALRSVRPEPTPMQREMRRAVVLFSIIGLTSCLAVVALHVAAYGDWLEALLAGITLAISNIPEEFPLVLTVFLALGAWRMAHKNALVRRAPAIEALGAVTVLCTDKTGTLTLNRMAVAELAADGRRAAVAEPLEPALARVLEHAALACTRSPHDPMERAILDAQAQRRPASSDPPRTLVREYPLSDVLAVALVWQTTIDEPLCVACKGTPEAVASMCALASPRREEVLAEAERMARDGRRVLAVADARWDEGIDALPLSIRGFRFHWIGLLGLADPIREGVRDAVAEARAAGVRVVMLTGDHPSTARAIARQIGLDADSSIALGSDLDGLDATQIALRAAHVDVFARVRPEHKLHLVRALKRSGAIVAMTGDGVNDAPALMAAHVGVAMGGRGTDVARESAAIVLLDDDFVTVVRAIGEGRAIYENLRAAVRFILAVHVPITGLALLPLLLGAPMVLLPLHVVFLELIVDPACSIVFERERPSSDLMRRPPRPPAQHLLGARMLAHGLGQGLAMFGAVAAAYLFGRELELAPAQLGALAFSSLVVGNVGLIALNRNATSLGRALREPNRAFWIVALGALLMLLIVTQSDVAAGWFGFAPPPLPLWLLALLAPLLPLTLLDAVRGAHVVTRTGRTPDRPQ